MFKRKKIFILSILITIFLLIFTNYINHKIFKSYMQQTKIFVDLNRSDYSNTPEEFYTNIESDIPRLTLTSIPLRALKAMYYFENEPDSLNYVKSLLKKSIKDNPYIKFSEGQLSQIYYAERKYDSAYYYARISFNGLPKNAVHFAMMGKLYGNKGYLDSIVSTFNKINTPSKADINKVFFASMNNFYGNLNDSLKLDVQTKAIEAKTKFKTDKDLQLLVDRVIYGKENIDMAINFQAEAQKLLQEKKYIEGIDLYLKALKIREINYPIIQTIGLAYYSIGDFKKSIKYLNELPSNGIPLDPLSLYVMGINKLNTRNITKGCDYLLRASKFGQKNAVAAYEKYCNPK